MKIRILIPTMFLVVAGIFLTMPLMADDTTAADVGAQITVGPAAKALAASPTPPANAEQKTLVKIPNTAFALDTKNTKDDKDSFWVQEVDVDGDGNVESANIAWDDEDKVLFIAYEDDFTCKNGGTGKGGVLIGINGEGNPRNLAAGSGFYAVSLDKGECGIASKGLWGCKFDPNGNPTACGVAVLDEKNDSILMNMSVQ